MQLPSAAACPHSAAALHLTQHSPGLSPCLAYTPAAGSQVGIPVLGVVENMSGLSQQLDKFKFFRPGPDGSQQDVTDQVMQHLPVELQVTFPSWLNFPVACWLEQCAS